MTSQMFEHGGCARVLDCGSFRGLCGGFWWVSGDLLALSVLFTASGINVIAIVTSPLELALLCLFSRVMFDVERLHALRMRLAPFLLLPLVASNEGCG